MPELQIAPTAETSAASTAPNEPPPVPNKPTVLGADMSGDATAINGLGTQANAQISTTSPAPAVSSEDSIQCIPPISENDSLVAAAPKTVPSTPTDAQKSAVSDRATASVHRKGSERETGQLGTASTDRPDRNVTSTKEEASSKDTAEKESGSENRVYSKSFAYMKIDGGERVAYRLACFTCTVQYPLPAGASSALLPPIFVKNMQSFLRQTIGNSFRFQTLLHNRDSL